MSSRGWLVIAVVAAWATTLGWHVKRLYFQPVSELLARAARTIPPGTAYYSVLRDGRAIGWAQTDVDTLPSASGFLLRDRLILREPLGPGLSPLRLQIDATLGPTFSLQRFTLTGEGVPGIRQVRGEVHGDTVLELELRGDGPSSSRRIPLAEPIVVAAAWPLRFALVREVEPGERFELRIFDPLTGTPRTTRLTVLEQKTRTFPDSVTAVDGRWVAVRADTVRAWWVEHDMSGISLRAWVDEDGRILEAEAPGGIKLERTAFELAYFGERVPDGLPAIPGSPAAEPATKEEAR